MGYPWNKPAPWGYSPPNCLAKPPPPTRRIGHLFTLDEPTTAIDLDAFWNDAVAQETTAESRGISLAEAQAQGNLNSTRPRDSAEPPTPPPSPPVPAAAARPPEPAPTEELPDLFAGLPETDIDLDAFWDDAINAELQQAPAKVSISLAEALKTGLIKTPKP